MPRKPKTPLAELPSLPADLLKPFGDDPITAEAINAASLAFKKALIERALGGELNRHLSYPAALKVCPKHWPRCFRPPRCRPALST